MPPAGPWLTPAVAVILAAAPGAAVPDTPAEPLDDVFRDVDAAFVVFDATDRRFVRHDPERARRRFSPCSTFKIANSLIALETGVVTDPDATRVWDPRRWPCESNSPERCRTLSRDHSMRSALRQSVVWFYREVAAEIGEDAMRRYLDKFDYGNRDMSSGLDRFWLSGSLEISADEQVAFLRRMHAGELASNRATDIVKDILVEERTPRGTLSAKTGLGRTASGRPLGWYVGYVERGPRVWFFALNVEADDWDAVLSLRVPKAREALAALGILDDDGGDRAPGWAP